MEATAIGHPTLPGRSDVFAAGEGATHEVPPIVLRRGVRLVVEVVGADGTAQKGALVFLGALTPSARTTGADGRADLGPQPPGYVNVSALLGDLSEDSPQETHRVLLDGEGTTHVETFRLRPR